jgi:hypothetical protein
VGVKELEASLEQREARLNKLEASSKPKPLGLAPRPPMALHKTVHMLDGSED